MADKEATVYIIDVGASMGERRQGRDETDLDWSMHWVWDKISTTAASGRKTWNVGVVLVRASQTRLPADAEGVFSDESYQNVAVVRDLGPMDAPGIYSLQQHMHPTKVRYGDPVSAVVVATEMINKFTKKLKYKRKIIVVTDGRAPVDGEGLDAIAKKLNQSKIELVVLGVDFDDAEYGFKEEDKSETKADSEAVLRDLVAQCDEGLFGTMAEAIDELAIPRIKPTRPFKNYSGPLTLGDPAIHKDALCIQVNRWFRTKEAKPPPASSVVLGHDTGAGTTQSSATALGDGMEGVELTGSGVTFGAVKNTRTYRVDDPDAPGGKRDVEFERLAKGYTYGREVVHISESDWNVTKMETQQSFSILGFVPWDNYEPVLDLGETHQIVPVPNSVEDELAFSSLVRALDTMESYAVARLVIKDGASPLIVLLKPDVQAGGPDCLYDVPLPFAEDVRGYQFPPLDRVITVTGSQLTTHRHLPTQELCDAMGQLVDAMDISNFENDSEGNASEYAAVEDTYSPLIHRINQAVRHRAVYPNDPVPPVADILVKYSQPPEGLVEGAQKAIDKAIRIAEVKKVPPKAKVKKNKESTKPLSGLDIDALLNSTPTESSSNGASRGGLPERKRGTISAHNAIPEFKQMVASATSVDAIADASRQMGELARTLITDSLGEANYARAAEMLRVMRDEAVAYEEPAVWNDFARDLKKRLLAGELGGDRRRMWLEMRREGLGLIDEHQADVGGVTAAEAKEFLQSR